VFDRMYSGFYVWGIGIVVVLGLFLVFMLAGWPGPINNCVWGSDKQLPESALVAPPPHASAQAQKNYQLELKKIAADNTCYCEAFSVSDAARGKPGVRQKQNTWFNLYAIVTSFIVAWSVYWSRRDGAENLIGSNTLFPDVYIFAVLFLGLGSMWFHGAIKEWGGITDDLSMYVFVDFLIVYTLRRLWISIPEWVMWVGYILTVALVTGLGEYLSVNNPDAPISAILILVQVLLCYLPLQIVLWIRQSERPTWRWWSGVGCIGVATFFWIFSQTGKFMCSPTGPQPHGLLWHPLAGAMAVFVYFYWRCDTSDDVTAFA
jgi:hypothetical protein